MHLIGDAMPDTENFKNLVYSKEKKSLLFLSKPKTNGFFYGNLDRIRSAGKRKYSRGYGFQIP